MQNRSFRELSSEQSAELFAKTKKEYEDYKALGLSLDMSRGKPAPNQLALSKDLLADGGDYDFKDSAGIDSRNYG
ncbi:MAG: aminotransferase, partial [Oscillospiraceae bacterium]